MHIALNAQLLSTAPGYRSAGVSVYSRHLLGELGALAVTGATEHSFSAWLNDPRFQAEGVELMRTSTLLARPPARIVWEQTLFPRELERTGAALVHGLVNVLPLRTSVPGVATVHDLSFVRMPETLPRAKRVYLRRLCAASVARAARVIAVSRQTADDLVAEFGAPPAKIEVVPNGVDAMFTPGTAADSMAFRDAMRLPDRFILYVGTLEPRKNLAMLLRGYARYRNADPEPAPLILAGGKGWFYDEIFTLVEELGIEESVSFPGYIPAEELPNWYRAATVFVYPSRFEGFGLPVLEAMACATPVICSDAPSLTELVGDAALIVTRAEEPGADELAAALTRVLADSALHQELSQRGAARAARFTWVRTAQETLAVYEQAANS
ncbi:MAG: glycosyltransferase family 4 protein [Caldilineaceae bacterium]|nr:glycosyltransferase family 4 protein [Caldilineaceae bacterium]